jgi:mono/diheme cytochrome c family protein
LISSIPTIRFSMIRLSSPGAALFALLFTPANAQDNPASDPGAVVYQSCVACHGADGVGIRADDLVMAPSLHDSKVLKGGLPELLTAVILKGITKQDDDYVQAMPPHEAAFNDGEIAALIGYVTREFGGKEVSVTPGEVMKWRADIGSRNGSWKRGEVESMYWEAIAPRYLSDLRYSLYAGEWQSMPDFTALEAASSAKLDGTLVSLDPAKDQVGGFGMAFDADFTTQEEGDFQFTLTSEGGAALIIDGETIVASHGVKQRKTESRKERLDAGHHTFRLVYFTTGPNTALTLAVKGPGKLGTQWLTTEKGEGNRNQSNSAIRLTPRNPGEAIVHRSFVPDAKPRAIGVGYPGAVNLVWDADVMNLAYVYRGEFMDVAGLWNGRGSASKPLGRDREKTGYGMPFQILEEPEEPWEPLSEAKVKYKRDTANPVDEITINVRHPDYHFHGYRLDGRRFPTFRYDFRKLAVTDFFAPEEIEGVTSLVRTLTIDGVAEQSVYLRVSDSVSETVANGWTTVSDELKVRVVGAETITRRNGDQTELLVPIAGKQTITISYRWNTSLQP